MGGIAADAHNYSDGQHANFSLAGVHANDSVVTWTVFKSLAVSDDDVVSILASNVSSASQSDDGGEEERVTDGH